MKMKFKKATMFLVGLFMMIGIQANPALAKYYDSKGSKGYGESKGSKGYSDGKGSKGYGDSKDLGDGKGYSDGKGSKGYGDSKGSKSALEVIS